jgi:SAM-dependent methyltransferase
LFAGTIGPVFLLVAAQASLMQRWFAAAPDAGDPYPLYAASNLGSFAGLITYPLLMEPRLSLGHQAEVWTIGYLALIGLVALAAASRWKTASPAGTTAPTAVSERPTVARLSMWLALAAVPSGLMLSTTTLLTTDLMAMPLLWVIPLGFYLLSFSIAFSRGADWARILSRTAPVLLLLAGSMAMVSGGQANPAVALAMVGLLFVLAVALHHRLYTLRPGADRLTLFYLVVAAGGALGGIFTALVAPVLFDWVYEHGLLLLAAAWLLGDRRILPLSQDFWMDIPYRNAIAAGLVVLAAVLSWFLADLVRSGAGSFILPLVLLIAAIGVVVLGIRWAFVAVLAVLMLGNGGWSTLQISLEGSRQRSYFGVYALDDVQDGQMRQLSHGTTLHGQQWLDPARRNDPTSYYGHSAGVGIALDHAPANARVGVVGLGAGTLACYRRPGQDWTFFEIDPTVLAYSREGSFTFLADCAPDARIVVGDARLKLAEEPAGRFDVLVIDAFSSDSIPLHLMTEEAFANYRRALDDDGLLMLHISNRYIDLAPMISALAEADGWHGRLRLDMDDLAPGLTPSIWIALARDDAPLIALQRQGKGGWSALPPPARRAWTDDNASIIPLIRW